jgi:hypothetical protein
VRWLIALPDYLGSSRASYSQASAAAFHAAYLPANQPPLLAKYIDAIIKPANTPNMTAILTAKFLSVSESFDLSNELIMLLTPLFMWKQRKL